MAIKVIIGGDFCITPEYVSTYTFTEELIRFFNGSDINVVNLECPVIDEGNNSRIVKTGPHLHTNNQVFNLLKQLKINVVTLANNHILDFGAKGLQTTIDGCRQNEIIITGAGENTKSASEPVIIDRNGCRIAFINFCENEFSVAAPDRAGANPLDIIENQKMIRQARSNADFVLVIVHGGHEHYNLPSPRMIKQYRFFAESGADAVISHHTHCISGYEIHNQIPIFYGLGNLIFSMHTNHAGWYNGLLVKFELEKGSPLKWELIPTIQSKEDFKLSLADKTEKENILKEIEAYSEIISDEALLNKKWNDFIQTKEKQYLNVFSPINFVPGRYTKAILRRLGLNNYIFKSKFTTPILNHIECEAHLDLSKAILHKKSDIL